MIKANNLIDLIERISDIRRFYMWKNIARKRVSGKLGLTQEQKSDIHKVFSRFKKVSLYANAFYTKNTGKFDVNYVPDELWYGYIEPFYNSRLLAKAMDSKVLYSRLLLGGYYEASKNACNAN